MVLVAGDHIGQGSLVVFQQLGGGFLFKVAHLFAVALVGSQEIHRALHKADGRHFVNDQKALFVCHLVQFFGIGVVAGAEAVCADPLHQLVIALDGSQVQAAAADVGIFVLAKTAQIHRFAVEQEVAILNFKGTDADLVKIFIDHGVAIGNADDEVVQVSGVHIPQLSIPDEENAVFMIGPWATAERSEKSRSWARRHIGEKGDDAVQSYYNGVRILSDSGFQASIVAVVSMMFPKEKFHLDQQKEFLPFHFTTDLRYFTEPEFQREIPIQMLEQRYANENAIWDAAACGNTEAALKACQQMARFTYGGRFFGSLYQTKIMLTVMNTLLRKAIERSNIHPYYIDEISSRYALMIENMVDEESWPLVQTMVKEYCAYVRRYSLQQYSPLVQKVINTINLNLSDQLSPKSLAAMYYISPSYLSSLFKQDTGTTLTDFINTQRIQRAANLLSSTEQNISVVAEQVGILDVNYFTKMFKKSMGSTPTQYRRQSRAR